MKQLTQSQKISLKIRLTDIINLTKGIALLTRRMKKDPAYINAQYLQALTDDAESIKYIVDEVSVRVLPAKEEEIK